MLEFRLKSGVVFVLPSLAQCMNEPILNFYNVMTFNIFFGLYRLREDSFEGNL